MPFPPQHAEARTGLSTPFYASRAFSTLVALGIEGGRGFLGNLWFPDWRDKTQSPRRPLPVLWAGGPRGCVSGFPCS